ncbi:MAG: DUF5596 domain-containing protein [Verrucomicrobia bacterium]|nr:DUF5596 domain-containing protein [Verrucomicrobiota bacterium]MBU4290879.1 DUF5596 domain-containing protein [Verrucomicrobiota bacterium]MBU4429688.1 DUF5596 domain-containing protein [Verrucomicrobiota bacterium]MBU4497819.1 DUF5596 domain-containing protein [Verrucomicrobiota bacterium]MCG2680628.1 acyltransferase domain-containing protein [Kiritimatiellia bacterium]
MKNSTNDLEQALAALNLTSAGESWRKSWPASQALFDPGKLFFLNPEFVADTCRTLGMAADVRDALIRALDIFNRHPELHRLAWHGHVLLFQTPGDTLRFDEWPRIPRELGESATLFYAFVVLSGVPALLKKQRDLGIPESITLDTLSDIELWIKEHRNQYGILGLDAIGWLYNHMSGRLFKIGRLQFRFEVWDYDLHAFRRRQSRQAILLAGDKMPFREDGQFADADGAADAAPAWVSIFDTSRAGVIRGHPIAPEGHARPNTVELARAEWDEIFKKGDPALGVHIPATGPMSHQECGESFRQACRFFPAHFPDRPWKAFTCTSWLLDPQFERQLPESSNIVRFLGEMYLHPVPKANARQTYQRVFGPAFESLPMERMDEAPQTTSLQRILVQHVKAGKRWRMGGCVLFPEDLDWRAQVYRKVLRADLPDLSAYIEKRSSDALG